jgi:hypothetical protein
MLSLSTTELHDTINNIKKLNVAQKFVCGEFMSPAITKCTTGIYVTSSYKMYYGNLCHQQLQNALREFMSPAITKCTTEIYVTSNYKMY